MKNWLVKLLILALLVPVLGGGVRTFAQGAAGGSVEMTSEVLTFNDARPFWVAVTVNIPEGETLFFRDSGYVKLNWRLSDGLSVGDVLYSVPREWNEREFGWQFRDSFAFLAEMVPVGHFGENGTTFRGVEVGLELTYQICDNFGCRDEQASVELTLNPGAGRVDPAEAGRFAALRATMPTLSPWPVEVSIGPRDYDIDILIPKKELEKSDLSGAGAALEYHFAPITPGLMSREGGSLEVLEDRIHIHGIRPADATYIADFEAYLVPDPAGAPLRLIARNSQQEVFEWLSEGKTASNRSPETLGIWLALGLAFLGGMILNLMPCVFPVLAMKAFALVKTAHAEERVVRLDGLAYTAGIMISFVAVAMILLLAKAAGGSVGWGFQLQSPAFVLVLMMIMLAVMLNFLGIYAFSGHFAGLGQGQTERAGPAGAFATGVLATVVATPCTAPFMAPAIGFALVQPPAQALSIFAGLGLGMAAPYLLISFIPPLRHILPRPGPWMVTFRKWLALPLFLTVLWLFWVFDRQTGLVGQTHGLVALLLLVSGLVVLGRAQARDRALPGLDIVGERRAALAMLLAAFLFVGGAVRGTDSGAEADKPGQIEGMEVVAWSPEEVESLRLQGRPIFLNVTAAWCITCLVHEEIVFQNPSFQQYLQENGIVYMVADWTNPDPRIASLLASYGRSGVPFYLFYPAGTERTPVLFPELLTVKSTLELLLQHR